MRRLKLEEECVYQNVKCAIVKKLKFVKEQEASRFLSNLGIKTPLHKILLLCPLLFKEYSIR